ncbi:MAG: hypothetical protein G01um101472_87 [Parcubacteria group bacterium Gr01-1014_72]|nr:MAG: hypothetical protein G01um101472_87 [Parcubacteria group bacterium Gr01-1014_72]
MHYLYHCHRAPIAQAAREFRDARVPPRPALHLLPDRHKLREPLFAAKASSQEALRGHRDSAGAGHQFLNERTELLRARLGCPYAPLDEKRARERAQKRAPLCPRTSEFSVCVMVSHGRCATPKPLLAPERGAKPAQDAANFLHSFRSEPLNIKNILFLLADKATDCPDIGA